VLFSQAGKTKKFEFANVTLGAFPTHLSSKQTCAQIQLAVIIKKPAFSKVEAFTCQDEVQCRPIGEVHQMGENDWDIIKNSMDKGCALLPWVVLIKCCARA